jgi:uncharacterized membrane protein YphA (DoxX/SURF4 family)
MIDAITAPWGALVLRVGLGVFFLAHGLLKLLVFKPAGAYGRTRNPTFAARRAGPRVLALTGVS